VSRGNTGERAACNTRDGTSAGDSPAPCEAGATGAAAEGIVLAANTGDSGGRDTGLLGNAMAKAPADATPMTDALPTEGAAAPLPSRTRLETQANPRTASSSTVAAPDIAGPRGSASSEFFIARRPPPQPIAGAAAATSCHTPSRALNARPWPAVAVPA